MSDIGPVQLISIGFAPGANFEGRIVDELAKLESERTIRLLDLLFIARDPDSEDVAVLQHRGTESMGEIVGKLLGIELDDAGGDGDGAFGFSQADVQEMADGLEPGAAAGLLLIEHVWARGLRSAIKDAGGRMLGNGFLTPDAIASVEPELAAMSEAIAASEAR